MTNIAVIPDVGVGNEDAYKPRRRALVTLAIVTMPLLLAACSAPTIYSAPLPLAPNPPVDYTTVVGPEDLVETKFFLDAELESEPFVIKPGDVLNVEVVRHPDLSRNRVLVLSDGSISLPLVPRIIAANKRLEVLGEELAMAYRDKKIHDPQVTVAVGETNQRVRGLLGDFSRSIVDRSIVIATDVDGALNLPFIDPIRGGRPLSEIQTEATEAYKRKFGNSITVTMNFIKKATRLIYVMGEVVTPGSIPYRSNLNPLSAVAAAGGFLDTADRAQVTTVRFYRDGNTEQWVVDLEDGIVTGNHEARLLHMVPGDVVYVGKSGIALANQFVVQYIRNMMPIATGLGFSYQLNP
jgi:polysaccharide export outer membrane protein